MTTGFGITPAYIDIVQKEGDRWIRKKPSEIYNLSGKPFSFYDNSWLVQHQS